jgi:hypothetical protein
MRWHAVDGCWRTSCWCSMMLRVLSRSLDAYGLAIATALALGCSGQADETVSASGAGGGAGSAAGNWGNAGTAGGGTGGTPSFTPDPGCRSSSDCPDSDPSCFLFGDGPGVCRTPSEPVSVCEQHSRPNECCPGSECSEGQCFTVNRAQLQCSPSAGFDQWNECVVDACDGDADCAGGFCTPAGFAPGRACIPAACSRDADCSAEPGGACAYLDLGCCEGRVGGAPQRDASIACVYPSDGCQLDSDCASSERCVVREGRARCAASCP